MLRNCPRCGRLFHFGGHALCPACAAQEEKEFDLVRTYLRDHPQATVLDAARETGVSTDRIFGWARQGRLALRGGGGAPALSCQACGRPIETGRLCTDCLSALRREVERTRGRPERGGAQGAPSTPSPAPGQEDGADQGRIYVRERFGKRPSGAGDRE